MTYYVSIGNSDDNLTQYEWSEYVRAVGLALDCYRVRVHGAWFSDTHSAFQNACWCFDLNDESVKFLKKRLTEIRTDYRQDSIAWAEAETEFI